MLVFHSDASLLQNPPTFFRHGRLMPHPETSERYRVLRDAVTGAGHALHLAPDAGVAPIKAVHAPDYVEFLRTAWDRRGELKNVGEELLATQFPRVGMDTRPVGLQGQLGFYLGDTSTSIRGDTWDAAYGAAQAAVALADHVGDAALKGEAATAYALCRPPGHHAYTAYGSGFCYLNNSAIAAQRLREKLGRPVAVLDIDVHHGNGTQGIFYDRADVLTISIHADTSSYFPFYCGYQGETGLGAGEGFNINMPLAHGSGNEVWLAAIRDGLDRVAGFGAAALVVALGLDASEEDPIGALKVTTDGFREAGALIASACLPTAFVQEGGYLCEALPRNLVAFLDGVGG